jgi:methylmalonyl-CoA/ethylmalonyl-CoA epimerase
MFVPPGPIHHIGIIVNDLSAAVERYCQLGFTVGERVRVAEQNIDVAPIRAEESWIELISPLDHDSGLGRFLASHGDGFHHVAYLVDDLGATLTWLSGHGIELIDIEPRVGLHGWRVAFVHPRSCAGVLTELVERSSTI